MEPQLRLNFNRLTLQQSTSSNCKQKNQEEVCQRLISSVLFAYASGADAETILRKSRRRARQELAEAGINCRGRYARILLKFFANSKYCQAESQLQKLILMTPELLSLHRHGLNALAVSIQHCWQRSTFLIDVAADSCPNALRIRTTDLSNLPMLACEFGSAEAADKLCKLLPDTLCSQYDKNGCNVLHRSCRRSKTDTRQLASVLHVLAGMCEAGVSGRRQATNAIEMPDRSGDTPMHVAAARGDTDALLQLIDFNETYDLNVGFEEPAGRCRRTPLMSAASAGAEDNCRLLLLRVGVDDDRVDSDGRSAYQLADSLHLQQQMLQWQSSCQQTEIVAESSSACQTLESVDSGICSLPTDAEDNDNCDSVAKATNNTVAMAMDLITCEQKEQILQEMRHSNYAENFVKLLCSNQPHIVDIVSATHDQLFVAVSLIDSRSTFFNCLNAIGQHKLANQL